MTGLRPCLSRILAVARVEALHVLRDRTSRSLLVVVPAMQLLLFGYTVNLDPRHVPVAVAGGSPEQVSSAVRLIEASGYFRIVGSGLASGAAERLVASGGAAVGIELPSLRDSADEDAPDVPRVVVDAADPAAVRPAMAALETAFLRRVVEADHLGGGPRVEVEWRHNPDGLTAWAVVPGLAGAVVMISMLMLGAFALVREREAGTWEGLVASPLTAAEALVGKLLPYLPLGVLQSALVVLLAHLLFALPVRGSFALLLLAAGLCAACYLAVGFAVSAVTRTQMQAMQAAVFLYLPSMLLSGFMFPFEGMPGWARAVGLCLPLTHFVVAARDVLLRGADGRAWGGVGWLLLILPACAALALAAYRLRREQG